MTKDENVVLTKVCNGCGEEKTLDNFYKQKTGKLGYRSKCKECFKKEMKDYEEKNIEKIRKQRRESAKRYRENHKEKVLLQAREHYKNNKEYYSENNRQHRLNNKEYWNAKGSKRRAMKKGNGGKHTKEQMMECLEFFNWKCAYSERLLCIDTFHKEHIIPVSKGGTDFIWNICPSECSINASKSNKDMEDWYRQQPYFSEKRLQKIYEWIEYAKNKYEQEVA